MLKDSIIATHEKYLHGKARKFIFLKTSIKKRENFKFILNLILFLIGIMGWL